MKTIITIQDAYIAKMLTVSPKSRNYSLSHGKAWRKAVDGLIALGMTEGQADQQMYAAHDMVTLKRAGVDDPLNHAA